MKDLNGPHVLRRCAGVIREEVFMFSTTAIGDGGLIGHIDLERNMTRLFHRSRALDGMILHAGALTHNRKQ